MTENKTTLESATTGSNPDIIIKHRFDPAKSYYVRYLIDHNGKDKEVTDASNDHNIVGERVAKEKGEFGDYLEYASRADVTSTEDGVANDLTPTFTKDSFNLNSKEIKKLQDHINMAAKNHNLMWKTVVSFSDDFLIREGLMDNVEDRNLDQRRIKQVIQAAMPGMLKSEGISESAEWFADIHLHGDRNKNHVHVHIATFEQVTKRPDKFNPVTHRMEPKGLFKQRTIDRLKKKIWRDMRLDKNKEHEIELEVNVSKTSKQVLSAVSSLELMKEQTHLINTLLRTLPDEKETKWRAKSNAVPMKAANALANEFINRYLETNGKELLHDFISNTSELNNIYKTGMGDNDQASDYVQNRRDQLQEQLVNRLYQNLREIDPNSLAVSKTIEIQDTPMDEQIRLKDLLDSQVKLMRSKDLVPPKEVTKELGLRKRAIRQGNLAARQVVIKQRLDYQKTYDDEDNLDLISYNFNDPLIVYIHEQLVDQDQLLELQQKPSFKRSEDDEERIRQFTIKYPNLSETPIKAFTTDYANELSEQRKTELELVTNASQDSLQLAYGTPDLIIKRKDVVDKLKQELKLIEAKGEVFNNNDKLAQTGLSYDEQQELKQSNAALFGKIAEIEGRENTFEKHERKTAQRFQENKRKKRMKQRFRGRKLNGIEVKRIINNLSYSMEQSNDIEQQTRELHEQEIERQQAEMGL
ncbi:MAG: relaxase MobL [Lactobacillaceae bacterium]|jgi:hypothetical protein|nr:relaxase MobL [Lactobacillaceae bacterium]